MSFIYETHLHTSQASACAISRGAEYIKVYRDLGFTGIFVTDHFMRGNSSLDRNLPWTEWVKRFCTGYENARNEGERLGFDVFFGWEETFNGDDYLIYGLDKNWLLEHPEARTWNRKEQYETVARSGGCVIQAHPFRQRDYLKKVCLSTGCVDGVEAANGGNGEAACDALALRYGQRLGLTLTAGTDIHSAEQAQKGNVFGISLTEKLKSESDYVLAIRENKTESLFIPPGRCDLTGGEDLYLPVEIRDKDDRPVGTNWRELLGLQAL
ncbi:MAG: PHP domain-containing protein [Treponema sp.]|jgi:hypothetical protein|nr:PHP domain-containing protein [Treponema sp.]